jgi:mono/diheme cytochrome c family protein
MRLIAIALAVIVAGGVAWLFWPWPPSPPEITQTGDAKRGEYVLRTGGCISCHTDEKNGGAYLAGGRAIPSPFGTFYASNITPDPETGIGTWTEQIFIDTIRNGRHMGRGRPLLPPMPFPMYAKMTDADLASIFAYLQSLPPIDNRVPAPVAPPAR